MLFTDIQREKYKLAFLLLKTFKAQ